MKRKKVSLIAGITLCALVALLTAVYVMTSGMSVHAEYIPPCDIDDSYAKEAILSVTANGLLPTYTVDGAVYFYPTRTVTRGEVAAALATLLEISPKAYKDTEIGFADENTIDVAFLPYIRAVIAEGHMKLYSDYAFHADAEITREETADIFGALCIGAVSTGKSETFSDFDTVSEHFATHAKKIAELEVMIGYPDGTFRPKGILTREEFALLLYRLVQNEHIIQRNS